MSELMPRPPLLRPQWDMGPSVDRDLSDLADQMHRCSHRDNRRFRLQHGLSRLLQFLRQHLVSIVVLLSLMAAALSVGAP
ncbi:MAG: hypothetical protein AB1430_22495 [Pseudomonadota bacterium]